MPAIEICFGAIDTTSLITGTGIILPIVLSAISSSKRNLQITSPLKKID